jgi:hypothetical protein
MATPPPPGFRGRHFTLFVEDSNGDPFAGAKIEFYLDGVAFGSVLNSDGSASVELPFNTEGALSAEVTTAGVTTRVAMNLYDGSQKLAMTFQRRTAASLPVAYCPDGTSGQPCVVCKLRNGHRVRICA